jgi:hypothetical protein
METNRTYSKAFYLNHLMKNFLFLFMLFFIGSTQAQELTLKGNLIGLTANTKVILSDLMGQKFHDTATVSNNSFLFNCKLPGAGVYVLRVGLVGQKPEHRIFYLDAGVVSLTGLRGELKKAAVSSQDLYMTDFLSFESSLKNQPEFISQKLLADTVIMRTAETGSYAGLFAQPGLSERFLAADKKAADKKVELGKQWLSKNPNSTINAYIIHKYLRDSFDEKLLIQSVKALNTSARNSLIGQKLVAEFKK